jgi:hypothetical protein
VAAAEAPPFRPPAVPLVTHDPYFSVWSNADRLTDDWTHHWTGAVHPLCGLARIDNRPFRFLGPVPKDVPPMLQQGLRVSPTQTVYEFEAAGVSLMLTFTSPLLPHDLDLLARPVSYLTFDVKATDGQKHDVSLYLDASAQWAVNTDDQPVVWARYRAGGLELLRVGTKDQPVLAKAGDNLRIDWGYFYLAFPLGPGTTTVMASDQSARGRFAQTGRLSDSDDVEMPRPVRTRWPVLAGSFALGAVAAEPVTRHVLIAYDDLYAIEYLKRRLRPYWRRDRDADVTQVLRAAERDYPTLMERCRRFDADLTADLTKAGGEAYARLAALAYRQCLAAHKLVADFDGTPLYFSKENFSNGCIDTVDVTYPSAPFFLLFNVELLKGQLRPVLDYARSKRWKFPFAPHDLGTYPLANGQVYGGGERTETNQMPVEESGNLLLLAAALAKIEGNAEFSRAYWPLLTKWAGYLKEKGLDPENQLCTDDFAGHLAHNTNLSLKAILALGGYAQLAESLGDKEVASAYREEAKRMAAKWIEMAWDNDHFRLTFDRGGTWSQKYNLVWDKLLGLDLFPPELARAEIAYYKTKQNKFGLPLDNRRTYTKLDWILWTATLAEERPDFEALVKPLELFIQQTPNRVPLTDWYDTVNGRQQGFQARSVVGGVFIKLLADPAMRQKWAPP